MTVEDPLSGIIGVGAGEPVGISFVGDLGPVVEVEGHFDQRGVGNLECLVDAPHRLVILG